MKVPLFVELCAGLASVSGVLEHGSTWKPPVSRMGRKTGYAGAILRVMGLRPRQRAERYLWAEADGDVAALLAAYTRPEVMREIAAIIRSWIPCPYGPHEVDPSCSRCKGTGRWDARDLWEVLRREERRGLWEGGGIDDTARYALHSSWSYEQGNTNTGFVGPGDRRQDTSALALALALDRAALPWPPVLIAQEARVSPGEVAGWAWSVRREMGSGVPGFRSSNGEGRSGEHFAPAAPAPHFDRAALPWPPVLIAQDAAVDVGSVAGWAFVQSNNHPSKQDGRSILQWAFHAGGTGDSHHTREGLARCFTCSVWPPVHLTPAADLPVPPLPSGTVVYMDPPYANTTGYKASFSRDQVCETAERWATAGAHVYISEAEPIAALGWHHVEITSERKGQARTFGATPEWLTCSHRPAWTPPQQSTLFTRPA